MARGARVCRGLGRGGGRRDAEHPRPSGRRRGRRLSRLPAPPWDGIGCCPASLVSTVTVKMECERDDAALDGVSAVAR